MASTDREKQPHAVSGGAREHRMVRRSGPATGASMAGRLRTNRTRWFQPSVWWAVRGKFARRSPPTSPALDDSAILIPAPRLAWLWFLPSDNMKKERE